MSLVFYVGNMGEYVSMCEMCVGGLCVNDVYVCVVCVCEWCFVCCVCVCVCVYGLSLRMCVVCVT